MKWHHYPGTRRKSLPACRTLHEKIRRNNARVVSGRLPNSGPDHHDGAGGVEETYACAMLAVVNGPETYLLLAVPITIAGMPLLFRSRAVRILSAVLILGWIVIGVAEGP
jgi:hypothetical protein